MPRSADEIAREWERREGEHAPGPGYSTPVVWGELVVWTSSQREVSVERADRVFLDLNKSGLLLAYNEDRAVTIYVLKPGWVIDFFPDAGE